MRNPYVFFLSDARVPSEMHKSLAEHRARIMWWISRCGDICRAKLRDPGKTIGEPARPFPSQFTTPEFFGLIPTFLCYSLPLSQTSPKALNIVSGPYLISSQCDLSNHIA